MLTFQAYMRLRPIFYLLKSQLFCFFLENYFFSLQIDSGVIAKIAQGKDENITTMMKGGMFFLGKEIRKLYANLSSMLYRHPSLLSKVYSRILR